MNTKRTPSSVVAINGVDAETYLAQVGFFAPFQDLDAKYNLLFFNLAATAIQHFLPVGFYYAIQAFVYHNDTTTYSFANGTTIPIQNHVLPKGVIDYESGSTLFSKHILSPKITQASSSVAPTSSTGANSSSTNLPGYPPPFVSQVQNDVSGYFLNGTGLSDVAILNIRSFEVATQPEAEFFQDNIREFLATCRVHRKTRLLIDVRGNGGGDLTLPIDIFRQLFLSKIPCSAIRWRLFDAANILGT